MSCKVVTKMAISLALSIAVIAALPSPSKSLNGGPSSLPAMNVNLTNEFLFTTLGITGGAASNQQILEGASGNSNAPASLSSSSSNFAGLEISGATGAVAAVNVAEQSADTVNSVDTLAAAAGSEGIDATLNGVNASVVYLGDSSVPLGGGITFAEANTDVEIMLAVE